MRSTLRRKTRFIALQLVLVLTWDGLAHAAKPSSKIAALEAAQQQAPAPMTRSAPSPDPAQPSGPAPGMSVHDRLQAAHTVFLSVQSIDPNFAVSGTDAYDAVLNALNQWGRFRVAADAGHADLVFQLHGRVTEYTTTGTPPDYTPSVSYISHLQLTVADPHTLSPLWEVNVPLQEGIRRKSKTIHVSTSGENVVSDLKLAAGDQLTQQDRAALKSIQTDHHRALAFGIIGVGALVGVTFLGIHLVHSHASSFCQAHNLSPCPGA